MTTSEQRKLMLLNQLELGGLVNGEAAELLGLSVRQIRRLRSAYRERGAAALAHGNRGRQPAHALDAELARKVVELATTTYPGFNQQHLTEMLAEHHGIHLSRPTVHRILKAAGIAAPRRRRPPRHRRRRDRYPREGMLVQIDASRHDWLEGRGPTLSLVGAIDDATGLVPAAKFRDQEDAQGYFEVLRQLVQRKGVPLALYSDRHSIFFQTRDKQLSIEEQLEGRLQPTQFGRLLQELEVELILARSPQAKGRIERLWGTFQDRLASELRLAKVSTLAEANRLLQRYLDRHNRRFTVQPIDPEPAWRPKPSKPDELFCFKFHRVVGNDHTVRLGQYLFDLPPPAHRRSLAKARVELHQRFDGVVCIYFEGVCLVRRQVAEPAQGFRLGTKTKPPREPLPDKAPKAPRQPREEPWRPTPNHPWKRSFVHPR